MVTGWKTYLLMLSMAALLILSYRLICNLQKIYTQIYKFLPLVIYQIKWPSNLKPYHFQSCILYNPKQPNLQPTEYVTPTLWPVAEFYQQKYNKVSTPRVVCHEYFGISFVEKSQKISVHYQSPHNSLLWSLPTELQTSHLDHQGYWWALFYYFQ